MADILAGVVICGQVGEIASLGRSAAMPDAARVVFVVVAADDDFLAVNHKGHIGLHSGARIGVGNVSPRRRNQLGRLAAGVVGPVAGRGDANWRPSRAAGIGQVQINLVATLLQVLGNVNRASAGQADVLAVDQHAGCAVEQCQRERRRLRLTIQNDVLPEFREHAGRERHCRADVDVFVVLGIAVQAAD